MSVATLESGSPYVSAYKTAHRVLDRQAVACISSPVLVCDTNVAIAAAVAAIAELIGAAIHAGLYARVASVSRPAVDTIAPDARLLSLHRTARLSTSLSRHTGPDAKTVVLISQADLVRLTVGMAHITGVGMKYAVARPVFIASTLISETGETATVLVTSLAALVVATGIKLAMAAGRLGRLVRSAPYAVTKAAKETR